MENLDLTKETSTLQGERPAYDISPLRRPREEESPERVLRTRREGDFDLLKIYCSQIGAITGHNPFTDPIDVIDLYIYQGNRGMNVWLRDVRRLQDMKGLIIRTEEEELEENIQNLPSPERRVLNGVRIAINEGRVNSAAVAIQMTKSVQKVTIHTTDRAKFILDNTPSMVDKALIHRLLISDINTSLGRATENLAAQAYEEKFGFSICHRDKNLVRKTFYADEFSTHLPPLAGRLQGCDPLFRLDGKPDGISEQMDEDGDWRVKRYVVEIKNRVQRDVSRMPHTHEYLQLVSYIIALDHVDGGDLVSYRSGGEGASGELDKVRLEGDELDCHTRAFFETVVPELKAFSSAIAFLRLEENRFRWLCMMPSEKRRHLLTLLPFLKRHENYYDVGT
jgi:hypothetical protein